MAPPGRRWQPAILVTLLPPGLLAVTAYTQNAPTPAEQPAATTRGSAIRELQSAIRLKPEVKAAAVEMLRRAGR